MFADSCVIRPTIMPNGSRSLSTGIPSPYYNVSPLLHLIDAGSDGHLALTSGTPDILTQKISEKEEEGGGSEAIISLISPSKIYVRFSPLATDISSSGFHLNRVSRRELYPTLEASPFCLYRAAHSDTFLKLSLARTWVG